jgi:hypothetical protein
LESVLGKQSAQDILSAVSFLYLFLDFLDSRNLIIL